MPLILVIFAQTIANISDFQGFLRNIWILRPHFFDCLELKTLNFTANCVFYFRQSVIVKLQLGANRIFDYIRLMRFVGGVAP